MTRDPAVLKATLNRPGTTPAVDGQRDWLIWLASRRGDLLAPLHDLLELSDLLLQDARKVAASPDDLLLTLERILQKVQELLALAKSALDQTKPETADLDGQLSAPLFHHEVRTNLAVIIAYCEECCDEPTEPFKVFEDDLVNIKRIAEGLVESIDEIFKFSSVAGRPLTDSHYVVGVIPPALEGATRYAVPVTGALLVVDDRESNRDVLRRRLERDGHTVTVAPDGRKALRLLRSQPFDLVLLDLMMPDLSGWQVLEQLKADCRLRNLPVIMISAVNELHSVVRCIEIGADDFLTRPINPVLLRARIKACLEKKKLRDKEAGYLKRIEQAEKRADELLHAVLPAAIVKELMGTGRPQPRRHENVAVLFADIHNFTPYCDQHDPEEVVGYLDQLVGSWEKSALEHRVQKIKTIGDAFMAAAGLLEEVDNPVMACVHFGLDMLAAVQQLPNDWDLRVGIHFGPVVAGVIGSRQYLYDLWGNTVNTAARMESHGVAGSITLSLEAWHEVAEVARAWEHVIDVKGKGRMTTMRFGGFTS